MKIRIFKALDCSWKYFYYGLDVYTQSFSYLNAILATSKNTYKYVDSAYCLHFSLFDVF